MMALESRFDAMPPKLRYCTLDLTCINLGGMEKEWDSQTARHCETLADLGKKAIE